MVGSVGGCSIVEREGLELGLISDSRQPFDAGLHTHSIGRLSTCNAVIMLSQTRIRLIVGDVRFVAATAAKRVIRLEAAIDTQVHLALRAVRQRPALVAVMTSVSRRSAAFGDKVIDVVIPDGTRG